MKKKAMFVALMAGVLYFTILLFFQSVMDFQKQLDDSGYEFEYTTLGDLGISIIEELSDDSEEETIFEKVH